MVPQHDKIGLVLNVSSPVGRFSKITKFDMQNAYKIAHVRSKFAFRGLAGVENFFVKTTSLWC